MSPDRPVHTFRRLPPYVPKNPPPDGEKPSTTESVEIDGHVYTLGTGTAAQIEAAIEAGTFGGFGNRASRAAGK